MDLPSPDNASRGVDVSDATRDMPRGQRGPTRVSPDVWRRGDPTGVAASRAPRSPRPSRAALPQQARRPPNRRVDHERSPALLVELAHSCIANAAQQIPPRLGPEVRPQT